jgi:hypothetical protein
MTEGYSEQQISALFDQLIDAQADLLHHHRVWTDYRMTRESPRPPASFESVKSLTDYNERKAHWEREERDLYDRAQTASRQLHSVAGRVQAVLPRDASITHTYGGNNAERQGHYRITNTLTDGIKAESLDSQER